MTFEAASVALAVTAMGLPCAARTVEDPTLTTGVIVSAAAAGETSTTRRPRSAKAVVKARARARARGLTRTRAMEPITPASQSRRPPFVDRLEYGPAVEA